MRWYVGPWVWDTSITPGVWRPPTGCGGLDFRPLPEQAQFGGTPGLGLFFGDVVINSPDYTLIGNGSWYDIKPVGRERAAIPRRRGYNPKGDDLVGIIFDVLTDGSDPAGLEATKPLRPTAAGRLEVNCRQKHAENFKWGKGHTGNLRAQYRGGFMRYWVKDQTHARKVLGSWCIQYGFRLDGTDWHEFVPPGLWGDVPGPLPPETTITESFNKADSETLGPDLTWSEYTSAGAGTSAGSKFQVVSNMCYDSGGDGNWGYARAESDLSSDDHYGQFVLKGLGSSGASNSQIGPACRFATGTTGECYLVRAAQIDDTYRLVKSTSGGALTDLATVSLAAGVDDVIKVQADGSTIKGYVNAVERHSVTDTAITGNTRCGLFVYAPAAEGNAWGDSFEAADLAAAGLVYTQLERGLRGMLRGLWTGRI